MERTTEKQLQYLVKRINEITGSPAESWTRDGDKFHSNVGNYHLDFAYGGVNLARIVNEDGGITSPLGLGYHTKRELYGLLNAFILGLDKNN